MVELLIALALGATLTFALLNALASSMRHATSTQNELIANVIIRELQEYVRASRYDFLDANQGTHRLLTNQEPSDPPGPTIRDRPVQLDLVNNKYSIDAQSGKFTGVVDMTITAGPASNSLQITIKVSYKDSTEFGDNADSALGSGRSISRSMVVFKNGTGAYSQ